MKREGSYRDETEKGDVMPFKSWQSYWKFSSKILHSQRYIYDQDTMDFLAEVVETCQSRQRKLNSGELLWRSQVGGSFRTLTDDEGNEIGEEPCPHPKERMCPLDSMATEGRVNPKGIPCLYLATTKETAMSECRPWVGSEVSVAQFRIVRDLTIIDCSVHHSLHPLYFKADEGFYEPDESEREKAVWAFIDQAFSRPVVSNENQAHYVPTQVIAEVFKSNGFDGVAYKSTLGSGHNIALFDLAAATLVNCTLFDVKSVCFEFKPASVTYFVKEES